MEHPTMANIASRIESLKAQIQEQIKMSVGPYLQNNQIVISDPVRTGMMESLAVSEANSSGLRAQAMLLKKALNELNSRKALIPVRELTLSNYLQQELNWAGIVNTLKAKQVEAEIKESEVISNISVVDTPALPVFATFPGKPQLIALFAIFAGLLSSVYAVIKSLLRNNYDNVEEMESDLNLPVLGVIPWIDNEAYNESDVAFAVDETTSFYALAYQKIISGMRIKGYNSGNKALAFTSSEFSKYRSTIITNIAYGLSKTGQSVVIVDADFRTPSIARELEIERAIKYSLSELIVNAAKDIQETGSFNTDRINMFVRPVPGSNNLFAVPNSENVSDPCEFLHSEAFKLIIQELKNRYDWVLVDVPPALAVPDAMTVGSAVDGMVIVTGLEVNRSVLNKVCRQFENYKINVFGVIAREMQTNEAASSNEYIKQMISKMMPQNPNFLADQ
jgi:capsular exopolysaccharide synthesis family protein